MLQKVKAGIVDKMGGFMALLCAIHCLALPFLLSFGIIWSHGIVEYIFLISAIIFTIITVSQSAKLHSLHPGVLILFVLGIIGILASVFLHAHLLSALGGIFLALAHYLNYRMQSKVCQV